MNERFTSDLVFLVVVLLIAALLGFIIGYLFRRIRKARLIALEEENSSLKARLIALEGENKSLSVKLDECLEQKEKAVSFNAAAARDVFKTKIMENDLKVVEGIGEKIESLLQKRGITTWYQLSQAPAEAIKDILLTEGGSNYRIHDPKTWPEQALMAYEGKWTQLKEYQDKLTAGK